MVKKEKPTSQTISYLFLASIVAITGITVILPEQKSTVQAANTKTAIIQAKSSSDNKQEPLPKHVLDNYQKLVDANLLLKTLKITGYSKNQMTNDGQIRGIWSVIAHENGDSTSKKTMFADMQFDSTTGELLNYGTANSPTYREEPKTSSQTEAFYRQKATEYIKKLLSSEHVQQYQKTGTLDIVSRSYNKVKRQVGTAEFDYKEERFQVVIDVNGHLEIFHRIPLSHLLKQR
ncbi:MULTISPECIES: hypothetical protein [Brevibacillus]|uniref:hypothetical protein n=1 Tax=Brevibacillus TaxID=55080 RepID=UPI00363945F2